jgi:hypothetical protein
MNPASTRISIALSAGGLPSELAEFGLGLEHIDEMMVRLAMALLRDGCQLAFGGTLGEEGKDLTRQLIEVATNWVGQADNGRCNVTDPKTWPLVNYSAWPNHVDITDERKARMVGICQFVPVDPPDCSQSKLAPLVENARKSPEGKQLSAQALSAMRQLSTKETDLRIVWAGRIIGASGWMAGILEEVGCSLLQGKPVLIFGNWGGCAKVIADYLYDTELPWPGPLSPNASADPIRDASLPPDLEASVAEYFRRIQASVESYRAALHSEDVVNQIPSKLALDALKAETARDAIRLATEAARLCFEAKSRMAPQQ